MENLRGMALMTFSMLGFAVQDMLIKFLSGSLSTGMIVSVVGMSGFLVFAAVAVRVGQPILSSALKHPAVLTRILADIIGTIGFVTALWLVPLATASSIFMSIPLLVTMGAALFLAEKVGIRRWAAILVGFGGMLIIFRPGTDSFDPNALFALLAAVCLSARDICARLLPDGVGQMQLGAWGFFAFLMAGLILLPLAGGITVPNQTESLGLFAATATGVIAYYAINVAMRLGEVSVVTPFRYTRLIFALILGLWVFGERPDLATLIGAGLIIASGLYSLMRERRLARLATQ